MYGGLWTTTPSIVVSELWHERNRLIFKNKRIGYEQLNDKVKAVIIKIVNNIILNMQKVIEKMTYWDENIRVRWIGFKIPQYVSLSFTFFRGYFNILDLTKPIT